MSGEAAQQGFHGLQQILRGTSGATAFRIVHPSDQQIAAHRHDWPFLALHRLGGYEERFDDEAHLIEGPSVVFHPAGRDHADVIGPYGLESVTLEFDPAWLGPMWSGLREASWVKSGGLAAGVARALQTVWTQPDASPRRLRAVTRRGLAVLAAAGSGAPTPRWMHRVRAAFAEDPLPTTGELAARLGLHPAWLARAYRLQTGEGLAAALRRRQVERAMRRLRTTGQGLADVAAAAGFCDQSHMNRVFRGVTGRTPLDVRREAQSLAAFSGA